MMTTMSRFVYYKIGCSIVTASGVATLENETTLGYNEAFPQPGSLCMLFSYTWLGHIRTCESSHHIICIYDRIEGGP